MSESDSFLKQEDEEQVQLEVEAVLSKERSKMKTHNRNDNRYENEVDEEEHYEEDEEEEEEDDEKEVEKENTDEDDDENEHENEEDEDTEAEQDPKFTESQLEHLQMQQNSLEIKITNLEEKLASTKVRKTMKDSYRLQLSNAEHKQKMLARRIAHEKRRASLPNTGRKCFTTLSKVSGRFLYLNGLSSKDILERKRSSKNSIKEDFFDKKIEEIEELEDYGKWKRLNANEKDTIDHNKLVIPRGPKATTKFFPPIPAPSAKRRPKDPVPNPAKKDEEQLHNKTENRLRLIPNKRRVAQNRSFMYEKQLEFASKYGLETKEIVEKLADNEAFLRRGSSDSTRDATRQQLFLMGALSRQFLNDNDDDDVTDY